MPCDGRRRLVDESVAALHSPPPLLVDHSLLAECCLPMSAQIDHKHCQSLADLSLIRLELAVRGHFLLISIWAVGAVSVAMDPACACLCTGTAALAAAAHA